MSINFHPKTIFITLLWIIATLIVFNIVGIVTNHYFGYDHMFGLIMLFDVRAERNIPTFYSSITLLFASLLLLVITLANRKVGNLYKSWLMLSVIFLFLAIDEAVSIHEKLGQPTREFLDTSGLFFFAWVIPYGLIVIVFFISYLKFLIGLPKKTAILFVISGTIYVAGAIGFELLGGQQAVLFGKKTFSYSVYYTCEELLEMLGIAIFIYALLDYISYQFNLLAITFSKGGHLT